MASDAGGTREGGSGGGGGAGAGAGAAHVGRNIAAAAIAGCVQPLIFNPLDVLRIRFQVAGPSAPASTIAFARSIIVREGLLKGLYLVGLEWNSMDF